MRIPRGLRVTLPACVAVWAVSSPILSGRGGDPKPGSEASGVARMGDEVLFVDDNVPGVVFHSTIVEAWGETALSDTDLRRDAFAGASLASDLESLVVIDGDVLILSEDLHQVLDRNGPRYTYAARYGEVGNRGMEGLAVRTGAQGTLRAAALWEGGYLRLRDLPPELRPLLAEVPLAPEVVLHVMPPAGSSVEQKHDESARSFALLVGEIEGGPPLPDPERYRGSDLVWNQGPDGNFELIVLLSSLSPYGRGERTFTNVILQRFDLQGHPRGAPFDVRGWLRANRLASIADANWEGLCWWDPGKSLCLVNDAGGEGRTSFVFVPVPENWCE